MSRAGEQRAITGKVPGQPQFAKGIGIMSLIAALRTARTEEDLKEAYIKSLGLKKFNKGLIDIRTDEIWFEAKETATPTTLMFAQLLCYVRDARKKGRILATY